MCYSLTSQEVCSALLRCIAMHSKFPCGSNVAPHLLQFLSAGEAVTGMDSSVFTSRVHTGYFSPAIHRICQIAASASRAVHRLFRRLRARLFYELDFLRYLTTRKVMATPRSGASLASRTGSCMFIDGNLSQGPV
jgi:hypothetical protein